MIRSYRRTAAACLAAVCIAGCGSGEEESRSVETTSQDAAATNWKFWTYTGVLSAFNPDGRCTNNCSGCSGCYPKCSATCYYYHDCPAGWYDLDWSGGYWGRGAVFYLPCNATYVSKSTTVCGSMWQPTFKCLEPTGTTAGVTFHINHLQHPNGADNGWLVVGHNYNAGTPVGLEGGTLANEGYPNCSTGNHLCMETPTAKNPPCKVFPTTWSPSCLGFSNADGPHAGSAPANALGCAGSPACGPDDAHCPGNYGLGCNSGLGVCTSQSCCCPTARACRSGSFPFCCPAGQICGAGNVCVPA
jgi:hypothetical protein